MKKTIAILLLLLSGSVLAVSDSDVYELQHQVKMLKMNQAISDRYITALENRIAALEDRSQPRKTDAEMKAMFDKAQRKAEATERRIKDAEQRTKAYEQQ